MTPVSLPSSHHRALAWMDIGQLRALSLSVRATGAIDCALHCGAAAKRREREGGRHCLHLSLYGVSHLKANETLLNLCINFKTNDKPKLPF